MCCCGEVYKTSCHVSGELCSYDCGGNRGNSGRIPWLGDAVGTCPVLLCAVGRMVAVLCILGRCLASPGLNPPVCVCVPAHTWGHGLAGVCCSVHNGKSIQVEASSHWVNDSLVNSDAGKGQYRWSTVKCARRQGTAAGIKPLPSGVQVGTQSTARGLQNVIQHEGNWEDY